MRQDARDYRYKSIINMVVDAKIAPSALKMAYAKYFAVETWTLLAHLTFEHKVTDVKAWKMWHAWVHHLNRFQFGRRYYRHGQPGMNWIAALEMQKRHIPHFHALLGSLGNARDVCWVVSEGGKQWVERHGDARIELLRKQERALEYIFKETAFTGEWDFYLPQ